MGLSLNLVRVSVGSSPAQHTSAARYSRGQVSQESEVDDSRLRGPRVPLHGCDNPNARRPTSSEGDAQARACELDYTHGFYVNMGGLVVDAGGRKRFPVTYRQILGLLDRGALTLPAISKNEIKDKSKADGLAKTLSCIQAGWLVVQCIGRAEQHLPISTLELTTLVFVMNSLLVYALWWYKPTDVEVPTVLCIEDKTEEELRDLIGRDALLWDGFFTGKGEEDIIQAQRIYNDSDLPPGVVDGPAVYFITAVTMAYGALHCAAWNFHFPTALERTLWRICSVLSIFVLPIGMIPGSWFTIEES